MRTKKVSIKIRRSIRAISPVISVLLMIAIVVIAAIIAYTWIMGYHGSTTTKVQKAIQIQSIAANKNPGYPDDKWLIVYVQNVGIGAVQFDPDACVYVKDVLKTCTVDDADLTVVEGQTVKMLVDYTVVFDERIKIKVVTLDGMFTEFTGTIKGETAGTPPANLPPTAAFTFSPSNPLTGDTVTFADGSTDSDGSVVAWAWTFDDGGTSSDRNPIHSYASVGSYTVGLTVTDDDGATSYVGRSVTVSATLPANLPPTAAFTFSPSNPLTGDTVTFTDGSTDSDGSVVAWAWTFGDGDTSNVKNPTHSYVSANTYVVGLTVTDDEGATSYVGRSVPVSAPIQYALTMYTVGQGTVNPGNGTYSSGAIVNIEAINALGWTFTGWSVPPGGTANTTITMDGPKTVTATFTQDQYAVSLNVVGSGFASKTPDQLTYTYGAIVNLLATATPGWSFRGWSSSTPNIVIANPPLASTTATIKGAGTITATFTQYTITFAHTGLDGTASGTVVTVNGSAKTFNDLSFILPVNSGDVVTYSYETTISGGSGKQFVSTDVTGPTSPITVSGPTTVTGNYKTQYYLTVSSAYGTPGGAGWYNSGATAQATVSPLTVPGPTDTQYVFTQWSGDASGTTSPSDPITMNAPKTATANWKTQYYLTMATNFGTVSPSSGWYDVGSKVTISAAAPATGAGERYVWNGWTGSGTGSYTGTDNPATNAVTMNGPVTETASWTLQYQVTFAASPIAGGSTTPSTPTWYNAGSSGNAISASNNPGYTFSSWSADPPSSITFAGPSASTTITVNGAGTITATFTQNQYLVSFRQNGAGAAPTVDYQIDSDSVVTQAVPFDVPVSHGSQISYTYQATVSGGSGTQYVHVDDTLASPQTITSALTITGNYKTQYQLTVTSDHDSPTPTSGWFDSGALISASVNSPADESGGTRYTCTGWTGTGSVPTSGSGTSTSFNIVAPSSITWNWKTQYYLTVNSAYGTPSGAGWYDSGATAYATVTPLTVAGPAGTQYVFTQWSGDASGTTSPSDPITMNAPKTATANWKTQYYLTMATNFGTVSPSSGWYDVGSKVTISATAPATGAGERYVWNGWTGSGTGSYSGTDNPATDAVTMNGPITETAAWTHEYRLTMATNFGTTTPPVGDTWYTAGSTVTISATAPATGAGERYVWNGWTGSGTGSYTGTDNPATNAVTMNGPVTETASWTLQYQVTFAASPIAGGSTTPSTPTWYNAGSSGNAISASNNPGYTFSSWSADPPSSITFAGPSASTTITVNGAGTITATFTQNQYLVSFRQNGAGAAPTVDYQIDSDSVVTQAVPFDVPVSHGSQISYTYQATVSGGSGTQYVLTSVDLPSPQTVTTPLTITGNYKTQYYLTVSSAYGTPGGAGWYNSGATAQATVSPLTVPGPTDTQYVFTQWSGDASGTTSPSNPITMNAPKTAVANWKTQYRVQFAVSPVAGGSTTPSVATWYDAGQSGVSITATVNLGYTFSGWTATGTIAIGNPLSQSTTATINSPGTITATFTQVFDHFTITGYPTSVTAGQSFGGVTVTAYDASNNVITGYTGQVYFTSTDSAAVLPYTSGNRYTFTSGSGMDNGVHTFPGFTLNTAGSRTITVTDGTKSATTTAITVTNPSDNINYNTAISPTSATTGSTVSFTYTITRELSYNNLGWASIQVPAGFTITGTPTVTDSNPPGGTWVATVAGNTITVHASGTSSELTTNGQYVRVTFSAIVPTAVGTYGPFISTVYEHYNKSGYGPGLLDGNDPTVNVYNAGVLDHFTITGYPSSRTAGQDFGSNNVVITAYDGGNNILTGYTGQVYFTSTDSQAVLPYTSGSKYTFIPGDSGAHTFAGTGFTLKTAGTQTITVTDGSKSATSNSITVSPASASKLVYTVGTSQTLITGQVSSVITVQRQDQYGNPVPVTSGDIQVNLATNSVGGGFYSNSGGTTSISHVHIYSGSSSANFYYKDTTAGTPTLTASSGSLTLATTQFTIVAAGTVLDHFTFNTITGTKTAGTPFSITITAKDAAENTVTGYSGTNSLSDSTGTINPTSTGTFTAGVWTGSVTITKAATGVTIDTSGATKLGTSNSFNVNPAAASKLVYTAGAGQTLTTSQVSAVITVQRQDQYGNPVPVTSGDIQVNLATNSVGGGFYSNSGGTTSISHVHIYSGSSSADFYYKDTTAGTPTLTASSGSLTLATTQFTINNYKLVYTTGSGQTLQTGQVSAQITVQRQDASSNPITSGSTTVNLASSSGGGTFYSDSGGTIQITYVTINSPSSSANFYYKDTTTGTPTLTASSTGYTPAQTTFTITGPNSISNPGFESDTNDPWIESEQNTGEPAHTHDSENHHNGGYCGETDTADMNTGTSGYASLTQNFNPAIAVTEIPNTDGTLTIYMYRDITSNGGDSVEVRIYASTGNYVLHYYWGASAPSDTSTDKYIYMGTVTSLPYQSWYQFTRNLYDDWTSKGLSSALSISNIELRCNGHDTSGTDYGQEIFWDDLSLQTT